MQARRSRHSTTIFDRSRAFMGYTLFSPVTMKPGKLWLIDMRGEIMHAWDLPHGNTVIIFKCRRRQGH